MGSEQSSSKSNRPTFVPNTRQNEVKLDYERTQAELKEIYEQRLAQERTRDSLTRPKSQIVQSQKISRDQASTLGTNHTLNQQPDLLTLNKIITRNQAPKTETTQISVKQQSNPLVVKQSVAEPRIQTIQSGQIFTRNQAPQIETNQVSVKQEYNPSVVKQSVAVPRTQTIQSGQIFTRNQAPQIETNQVSVKEEYNPSAVKQSVAVPRTQTIQSGGIFTRSPQQSNPSVLPVPAEANKTSTVQSQPCFTQPRLDITSSTYTQNDVATSLERNRTPYSYSSDQLQNVIQQSKNANIYPNLNNKSTHTSQGSTSRPGPSPSSVDNEQDFVFINRSNVANRVTPSAPPRDRSQSSDRRSRSRNNNNQKSNNLSCRTCSNKFSLKIYQCPNGHSSCSECHSRNALCGLCRLNITDMRNIMLEDYISQQKVPCVNAADGCSLFLKMLEMENHIKECPFKEIVCPVNGICGDCNWRGKTSQLANHFNELHPTQTQGDVDTEMVLLNICFDDHILYLVTLGTYNFLLHIKVCGTERKIFMAVQLLGTTMSTSKWNYEIHVYNKREPRRKYQFTDLCTSSSTLVNDLFRESKCATLPLSYAMTFVNDGIMYYKFFIKQEIKTDFNKNRRGRGAFRGRHNNQ